MALESEDTIPDETIMALYGETMITLYMVVSSIDDSVLHGPFATYDDALAFAEAADGSVFECTMRLIDIKEV
jgi:hypothetical protein